MVYVDLLLSILNWFLFSTLPPNLYIGLIKSDLTFQMGRIGLINARSIS